MSMSKSIDDVGERVSHDPKQLTLRVDGLPDHAPLRSPKKEEIYDEVKVCHALFPLIDVQELKWVDADVVLRVSTKPAAKRPRRPTDAQLHLPHHVTGTLNGAPILISKQIMLDLHRVLQEDDNDEPNSPLSKVQSP